MGRFEGFLSESQVIRNLSGKFIQTQTIQRTICGNIIKCWDDQGIHIVKLTKKRKLEQMKRVCSEDPKTEIEILKQLQGHPAIIRLEGDGTVLEDQYYQAVTMEYCQKDLLDFIKYHVGPLPQQLSFSILSNLIDGIEYMHSKGIAHLDLSPENIMLTKRRELRIIDFGQAQYFHEGELLDVDFHKPGKDAYRSVEIQSRKPFLPAAADIWSFGVIMFIVLFRIPPFKRPSIHVDKVFQRIYNQDFRPLMKLWKKDITDSQHSLFRAIFCPQMDRITGREIKHLLKNLSSSRI